GSVGGYVDMTGMPPRAEVLGHYAQASGRQVDDIDYYVVLARWKLAIVLEQGYQRAAGDPKLEGFGPIVLQLMRDAAELAETSAYRGGGLPSATSTGRPRGYAWRTSPGRPSPPATCGSGSAPRRSTSPTYCSWPTSTRSPRRPRSFPAASSPARWRRSA